jgi:hypothetical protein
MSLESWKEEFLTKTDLEKWIGLRKENLEKHDCSQIINRIYDKQGHRFNIEARTCQLCANHLTEGNCRECPLSVSRDFFSCDDEMDDENEPPFTEFTNNENPEPMIEALTAIKDQLPHRTSEVNL